MTRVRWALGSLCFAPILVVVLCASAPALAQAPAAGDSSYSARLKSLERSANELSERVTRLRGQLSFLKDTVLGGAIGSSRCVVRHKNEMGSTFRLIRAVYALDGIQILSKVDDTGRLAEMTEFDVYNGAILPGAHTLTVHVTYQGHGLGVFSYLKNYKFDVRSSHSFTTSDGKTTVVEVVGFEKAAPDTKMEDKPAVDFRVKAGGQAAVEPPPAKK